MRVTDQKYEKALELIKGGTPQYKAIKAVGLSNQAFYLRRKATASKAEKPVTVTHTPKSTTHTLSDAAAIALRDENTRLKLLIADMYLKTLN